MSFRIIGGEFRGRVLAAPKGSATRPTAGMVREAFFNICRHSMEGGAFLDLCAGSGAMGLEALSRGANSATFVENDALAAKTLRKNIELLAVVARTTVIVGDAVKALGQLKRSDKRFDVIYVDPPYDAQVLYDRILNDLDSSRLLADDGDLFVEEAIDTAYDGGLLQHLTLKSCRRYGKSQLRHYRWSEA